MKRAHSLTLAEVVVSLFVVALAVLLLVHAIATQRMRRLRWSAHRCRNNLNQLAKGMSTYLNEFGDNRFFPWPAGRPGCGGPGAAGDFGGAEWLATLYWTRTLPDSGVYLCANTTDWNENGRDLGVTGCAGPGFEPAPDGKLKPDAVSYAAFGATSAAVYEREKLGKSPVAKLAIRDDLPPDMPMACDDTEGPVHHGNAKYGGMSVLFFDSHVEFWTHKKIGLERCVGTKGGPLAWLRN
jgi:hypothetical protein